MGQRPVRYLGEINDSPRAAGPKASAVFAEQQCQSRPGALLPEARPPAARDPPAVPGRRHLLQRSRPRPWGAGGLGDQRWRELPPDPCCAARLGGRRAGTDGEKVLRGLTLGRLLSPGSEGRWHRPGFGPPARADRRGVDERPAPADPRSRGRAGRRAHQEARFAPGRGRGRDRFGAQFDGLRYDLTRTDFECAGPAAETEPRRCGDSRAQRPACGPVIVARVVPPAGRPRASARLPGHPAAKTPRRDRRARLHKRYGQAERIGVMARGSPTEAVGTALRPRPAQGE